MNSPNDQNEAPRGVPSFIEFVPDDAAMSWDDADTNDCDMLDNDMNDGSSHADAASDEAHHRQAAPKADEAADVTRQELDAMKRMIQDMRRRPELLHQSQAYSRSFRSQASSQPQGSSFEQALQTSLKPLRRRGRLQANGPAPSNRVPAVFNSVTSASTQGRSSAFFQSMTTAASDGTSFALITPGSVKASYCQECHTSIVSAQKLGQVDVSDMPPPPFR